jgi:glycosyltransferase involved in cell wall biosynthesis
LRAGVGARVVVVPPGVDVDHFDWETPPPRDRLVVLYAGRIAPGRRVRVLLEAASLLRERWEFEVWLVGPVDESLRQPLSDAVRVLGLSDRVREVGTVDHGDMPRVIAQAAVCVVPGAPDEADRPLAGPPLKLLESMACRRATIAPQCSSVAEIVRPGVEGLLFAPGDPRELASCLDRLFADPALREELASAGYRTVRERYPASASRRRLLESYARLVPPESLRPVASALASPVDALPAYGDTFWGRDISTELDDVRFQAAGDLLEGGFARKPRR